MVCSCFHLCYVTVPAARPAHDHDFPCHRWPSLSLSLSLSLSFCAHTPWQPASFWFVFKILTHKPSFFLICNSWSISDTYEEGALAVFCLCFVPSTWVLVWFVAFRQWWSSQLAWLRSFCVRMSSFVISEASRILSSGRVMSEGLITEVLFHCRSLLPIFVSTRWLTRMSAFPSVHMYTTA